MGTNGSRGRAGAGATGRSNSSRGARSRSSRYPKLRPGPGRSAEDVAAHQRGRLQEAMVELVAEHGYNAVAVAALSNRAQRLEARLLQALRRQGGVLSRHLRHHRQPLGARDPRRRRGRGGVARAASARVSRLRRPDRRQPRGGAAGPGRGLRRRRRRGRADAAYEPALRGAGGEELRPRRRVPPAAATGGERHRRRLRPGGAGAAALRAPAAAGARRGRADGVGALLLRRRRRPPARPRGRGAPPLPAAAAELPLATSAR